MSSLLAGYGFGLTAFAGSVAVYALTICVWTVAEIVNAPIQSSLVVRLSPARGRGRYQGMYTMSWSAAALIAPLMSGLVIDRFGAQWLWGACAVLGTGAALGYWLLMRNLPGADGTAASEGSRVAESGAAGASGADAGPVPAPAPGVVPVPVPVSEVVPAPGSDAHAAPGPPSSGRAESHRSRGRTPPAP